MASAPTRSRKDSLAGGALAKCRVAVLPYNPALSPEAVDAMVAFVGRGGKVWLSYQLPPKLAAALGFGQGKYLKQERPGQFAEIRFDAPDVVGLPKAVRQASWNIITATPEGHGARAIGQWHDDAGKPTGQPAMLLSDRGAYLTHVLLPDDRDGKKQLLAAVLGRLDPALWQEMAEHDLREAGRVGHCAGLDEVAACLRAQKSPAAEKSLDEASRTLAEAKKQFDAGEHYRAGQLARDGHRQLVDAYLRGQPSPEREGRAWWTHSGTGAYPGDWDRTARELSAGRLQHDHAEHALGRLGRLRQRRPAPQRRLPEVRRPDRPVRRRGEETRSIEVHVWKVNYYLSHRTPKEFLERLGREGRLQVSNDGKPIDWLCPSHPENFELELRSMVEIARKYDVDGLHFDYIRYPGGNHCYCDGCRERFEAASGRKVEHWPGGLLLRLAEGGVQRLAVRADHAAGGGRAPRGEADPPEREDLGGRVRLVSGVPRGERPGLGRLGQGRLPRFPLPDGLQQQRPDVPQPGAPSARVGRGPRADLPGHRGDRLVAAISRRIASWARFTIARSLGASGFTIFNLSETTAKTILPGVAQGATARKAVPPHEKP